MVNGTWVMVDVCAKIHFFHYFQFHENQLIFLAKEKL